jgi:BMFP domain-containing protein YqiC
MDAISYIIPHQENSMSENTTQETPDARSFEERVFARFDMLDARLDKLDGRLTTLEETVDARLRETRPIWEVVLSRLDSVEGELKSMNRQMRVLHGDVLRVRGDQEDLHERISKLESEPTH